MCTGACLRAAARHWAQLGLGPGAHNSPAELAPAAPVARRSPRTRLLRRRHLHVCIWHENACSMICNFETSLTRIHAPLPETTRRPKFCKPGISGLQSGISGVSGLIPRVFGFARSSTLKTENPCSAKTSPPKLEVLFDTSLGMHIDVLDQRESIKTS